MTFSDHIHWFRHASPYIKSHQGNTFVIMVNCDAIVQPNFKDIIQDIVLLNSLGVRIVLVHGTDAHIDQQLQQNNQANNFHQNIRITDQHSLAALKSAIGVIKSDIESLVNQGLINTPSKQIITQLINGQFITTHPMGIIDGIDVGFTGNVRKIDHQAIKNQLDQGYIVLIPNCGYSTQGQLLYLEVTEVASQVAIHLNAEKLILFGHTQGLLDTNDTLLKQLTKSELTAYLSSCTQKHSLAQTALRTIEYIPSRVHILNYLDDSALLSELFTREGSGTLITQDRYEQLRTANVNDTVGLLDLLHTLMSQDILVQRSAKQVAADINRFTLLERDGMIVGCAALYFWSNHTAELSCVAIRPEYQNEGCADRLLKHIEQIAKQQSATQLFALTTHTHDWFTERHFKKVSFDKLPKDRQATYDQLRKSDIFIKPLTS